MTHRQRERKKRTYYLVDCKLQLNNKMCIYIEARTYVCLCVRKPETYHDKEKVDENKAQTLHSPSVWYLSYSSHC